jgi:hypothetical protein
LRGEHLFDTTGRVTSLPRPLPRRDAEARTRLREVAGLSRPIMLAREQALAVAGPLGELIPGSSLPRGTVVTVEGAPGAGRTSLAFALAAAATDAGEWAGAVDLDGSLGAEAAAAAGVALERFPVVRGVPPDRWATVVAALLDGTTLVLAEVSRHVRTGDARRLVARARERRAVLVALPQQGARWPADAALRLVATGGAWRGIDHGAGLLEPRELTLRIEGHGAAARPREGVLARAV